MAELNAGPVIDRMQQVVGVRTDIALGAHFGYGTSAVSGWRSRDKVPYEECVTLAIRKGISLDWLLLGIGSMDGAPTTYQMHEGSPADDRVQRMLGFFTYWDTTRSVDEKVWLEMQLARSIPEYAEWVSARSKSG